MAARKVWRERYEAGARSVDKDFMRFAGDADEGLFALTCAQAKADFAGIAGSDLCFDFERVAFDVGGANFVDCLLNGESVAAKQLLCAELLNLFDRCLNQTNTVSVGFKTQRSRQGLCAAPQLGGLGVRVLPVADPTYPDSAAVTGGNIGEAVGGVEILAIVGPELFPGRGFAGELRAIETAYKIFRAGSAGGSSGITVYDHDPFFGVRLFVEWQLEEVGTLPLAFRDA